MTRAHVIAWRKDLEGRGLSESSIRRKLAALSSFFDALRTPRCGAALCRGGRVSSGSTRCCTHSLQATGATNALEHGANIAEVQAWLGHADISTTRLYDHRRRRPEESPTFRVRV